MWMQVFRCKKKTYINKLMKVSGHRQETVESFCNIDLQHRICKISERERERERGRRKREREIEIEPASQLYYHLFGLIFVFL